MSDNTELNLGSGGAVYGDDEIGNVHYQRIKLIHGADGVNAGDVARTNPFPVHPTTTAGADVFTAAGVGTTLGDANLPCKYFGLQVTATGAVTSWTVALEGSLDGTTWTTIATHTQVDGTGATIWNPTPVPCRFFRTNCTAIVLGAGTNVVAILLGMN